MTELEKKILKDETGHILDNWKFFGYDKRPHKQNVIDDILSDFEYVKSLYIERIK